MRFAIEIEQLPQFVVINLAQLDLGITENTYYKISIYEKPTDNAAAKLSPLWTCNYFHIQFRYHIPMCVKSGFEWIRNNSGVGSGAQRTL